MIENRRFCGHHRDALGRRLRPIGAQPLPGGASSSAQANFHKQTDQEKEPTS